MPGWAAGGSPPLSSLEVQVKVEDVKGPSRPSTACRLVGILAALLVVGGTAGVAIPLALRAGATAPESDAPTVPMRASGAGVTSSLLATTRADWKEDDAVVINNHLIMLHAWIIISMNHSYHNTLCVT